MADEPRRSGRATKGQHKNLELAEPAPSKRKGKAKAAKQTSTEPTPPETNEEDEIIRCVCGEYEEEEDVERDMICCDNCSAWQHNDCMGLSFAKGQEPAEYYCEKCKPENHEELLGKMARGEKPWEEAARKRAQEAAERKSRKKKGGKRGRKARSSDVKTESETAPSAAVTPSMDTTQGAPRQQTFSIPVPQADPANIQKRKYEEDQGDARHHEGGPMQKLQRLSTSQPTSPHASKRSPAQSRKSSIAGSVSGAGRKMSSKSPTDPVSSNTTQLTTARQSAVDALNKLLTGLAQAEKSQGTLNIPSGKTVEDFAQDLATAIEQSMYKNLWGSSGESTGAYKQQLRTILFNVKKNRSLSDSLLVGRVTPDAISKMSTQNMASEELRQRDEEIKREAERQSIIIQEEGPRIRRTHKGEEFVEADEQMVGTESIFSTAPARRDTASEIEPPSATTPRHRSPTTPHGSDGRRPSQTADQDNSGASRRRSSGFNIENVWSSVHSPGAGGGHHDQQFGPAVPYNEPPPSSNKVQDDAEIDKLLKDEDVESPPYSPKDFHSDMDVWRGTVSMNAIADFNARARHVGGADLSGRIPWSQLIPQTVLVDGRIDTQLASNYLCGLRYSHTTDITVIAVSAADGPNHTTQFNRLFEYFVERNRYGVVGKPPHPAVKDTYIVPVEAGASKKPEFIELLENNTVEDPTPERLLLVVFVVKTSNNNSATPSALQTPQDPSRKASSPLTTNSNSAPNHTQATPSGPPLGMVQTDGPSEPVLASLTNSQPYIPPPAHSFATQSLTGRGAAIQVLGPLADSPAVEELLRRAPDASVEQLTVIAGLLATNPTAASNYQALMNALLHATNGT